MAADELKPPSETTTRDSWSEVAVQYAVGGRGLAKGGLGRACGEDGDRGEPRPCVGEGL